MDEHRIIDGQAGSGERAIKKMRQITLITQITLKSQISPKSGNNLRLRFLQAVVKLVKPGSIAKCSVNKHFDTLRFEDSYILLVNLGVIRVRSLEGM